MNELINKAIKIIFSVNRFITFGMEASHCLLENVWQSVNELKKWADILAPKFPEIQQFYKNVSFHIKKLKKIIEKNPNAISYASIFALFAASIAFFLESYSLSQKINEHIGKVDKLVPEFSVLYNSKIKPWLVRVNQKLGSSHKMMSVGEVKRLKSELESFTKSVDEILEKVYSESLNNMQCQTKSNYLVFLGLGFAVVAVGAAFVFPPAGPLALAAYVGSGVLGLGTTGFSLWNSRSLQETKVKVDKLVEDVNERRKEIKTTITRLDMGLMDLEAEQK